MISTRERANKLNEMGIAENTVTEPTERDGFVLLRLTCLVTQANELQLDGSQLTLAIRLKPREMERGGVRK